jgi:propanol-preferring alcohol dehydrogenase
MKAWLFHEAGRPLEMAELPDPVPNPGWLVLDVGAAGLCHSDVTICDGPGAVWLQRTPIVLGHEIAGTVRAVGAGVAGFSIGDRVGLGSGPHSLQGGWSLPLVASRVPDEVVPHPIQFSPGLHSNGGFAEQVLVPAHHVVRIPKGVSLPDAAVANDAIATAYHAVRTVGAAKPGEKVVILGLGGLGLNGVQVALLCGATVYGVDPKRSTFEQAYAFGVTACHEDTSALRDLKPDLIVDFAGMPGTLDAAVTCTRIGGRVVAVGLGVERVSLSLFSLVCGQVEVRGSLGYNNAELAQVYEFLAQGKLTPLTEEVPFDALPDAIEMLRAGKAKGRLFTRPNG